MAKTMKIITAIITVIFVIFIVLYALFNLPIFLSLCITFGTCLYHFIMGLTVGVSINLIYHNKVNYNRKWFFVSKFENKIYKKA